MIKYQMMVLKIPYSRILPVHMYTHVSDMPSAAAECRAVAGCFELPPTHETDNRLPAMLTPGKKHNINDCAFSIHGKSNAMP